MADSRQRQGKNKVVPQSRDMLREHGVQPEMAAVDQIWDFLTTKVDNCRNTLNTKRILESLMTLEKLKDRRKFFLYETVTTTFKNGRTTVTENETHYFTASKAIIDSAKDHQ